MNERIDIDLEEVLAYIGRLVLENRILQRQLAALQQQIAQSQVAQKANGKEPAKEKVKENA